MKQAQVKTLNISEDILGIVTSKERLINRKRYIFWGDCSKEKAGYLATVSRYNTTISKGPMAFGVASDFSLNDGDVILLTPDGLLTVLYDANSEHNAIMATERCNHRCIMCPQPPIVQEKDKTPFNISLIDLIVHCHPILNSDCHRKVNS